MRQHQYAVVFKCSICGAACHHKRTNAFFTVRLTGKTFTTVKRFCSLACLRAWVREPRL